MELRQLEYLVAVADDGGFTRAATRLHVAQPGVSAQIRRLEAELGQELLDRTATHHPSHRGGQCRAALRAGGAGSRRGVRLAIDDLSGLLGGRSRSARSRRTASCPYPSCWPSSIAAIRRSTSPSARTRPTGSWRACAPDAWTWRSPRPRMTSPAGVGTQTLIDTELAAAVAPGDPLAAATR